VMHVAVDKDEGRRLLWERGVSSMFGDGGGGPKGKYHCLLGLWTTEV
jgi:hypothetical protein